MSQFVGPYVRDLSSVLLASALSGQNAYLIGAPGWGKTALSLSVAAALVGEEWMEPEPGKLITDQHAGVFVEISPASPPDVLTGPFNPAELLAGRMVYQTYGTPYHGPVKIAILDELGRGNDATFDKCLHVTNRQGQHRPPVWATSNFMPQNERVQALIDRFLLWYWIHPERLDVPAMTAAQLGGNGGPAIDRAGLPTWAEVEEIRAADAGINAINVIGELLRELSEAAAAEGRQAHPRRITQWSWLLFRVGLWKSGSADFSSIPDDAAGLLQYAWPATTAAEAASWKEIVASVVDVLGAAIEAAMAEVQVKLRELSGLGPRDRNERLSEFTMFIQRTAEDLERLAGPNNAKVEGAITQMQTWLSQALQGKPIE